MTDKAVETTTDATPMVSVRGVHKFFGDLHVLRGIDLDIAPGEVCVILGPSGSGKSTLLRCLNLLEKISAGRVYVDGELLGYREYAGGALFEHIDQGRHKARVGRDGIGALVGDPQARGGFLRLGVEVVDDLHVVADEPDGDDNDAAERPRLRSPRHCRVRRGVGNFLEEIVDIGFEPARLRRPGTRAKHEVVAQVRAPEDAPQLRHDRLDKGVMLGDVTDFGCRGSRRRRGLTPPLLDVTARGRRGLIS